MRPTARSNSTSEATEDCNHMERILRRTYGVSPHSTLTAANILTTENTGLILKCAEHVWAENTAQSSRYVKYRRAGAM